jgi:hypothetical protein
MVFLDESLEDDFRRFEKEIRTDPVAVLLARLRRDKFTEALMACPDVAEVIPSGSLARGTNVGPLHDVDLIVVYKAGHRPPGWGSIGESAENALEHLQGEIGQTLQGGPVSLVQETQVRNHVIKCSLDPWPLDAVLPRTPPVDVMPAIRKGNHLRVPERENSRWIDVDPERLVKMVAARERQWGNFKQVVRMVKYWADHHGIKMKNLAVEVLVLEYCPRPGFLESLSCSDAVVGFFKAAAKAKISRLFDPTGRCGEIDPHLDYAKLRRELDASAKLALRAVEAERAWQDPREAVGQHPQPEKLWREIFGPKFARPSFWSWLTGRRSRRCPAPVRDWLAAENTPPEPAWPHEQAWDFPGDPTWQYETTRQDPERTGSQAPGDPGPGAAAGEPGSPSPTPRPGPERGPTGGSTGDTRRPGWIRRSLAGVLGASRAEVPAKPVIFG